MKAILRILTATLFCMLAVAAVWGRTDGADAKTAPAEVQPELESPPRVAPVGSGEHYLAMAIDRIGRYRTIHCKLRHRVDLFGNHLVGAGNYLQARDPRGRLQMRLELRTQIGTEQSVYQQVSDGNLLWIHRRILSNPEVARVDLNRVRAEWYRQEATTGVALNENLAVGGLARLLESLTENFEFPTAEPQELGGLPVWLLRGRWRKEKLDAILQREEINREKDGSVDFSQLDQPLPEKIYLVLGQEDLFPYRMEYRRRRRPEDDLSTSELMVVMDLFEVQVNTSVDPNRFVYTPSTVEVADRTDEFMKRLGL